MPVRDLVIGLSGAAVALLATLILALCLAETRHQFGQPEWGVWWMPGKSWSKHFSPIWQPALTHGAINAVFGWLLAGKLTSKRSVLFATAAASVAVALAWLIGSPLGSKYGAAGRNTVWFCDLFFAFAGAYAGASLAEQLPPKPQRLKRTRPK